jgi:hypothetical protein
MERNRILSGVEVCGGRRGSGSGSGDRRSHLDRPYRHVVYLMTSRLRHARRASVGVLGYNDWPSGFQVWTVLEIFEESHRFIFFFFTIFMCLTYVRGRAGVARVVCGSVSVCIIFHLRNMRVVLDMCVIVLFVSLIPYVWVRERLARRECEWKHSRPAATRGLARFENASHEFSRSVGGLGCKMSKAGAEKTSRAVNIDP